MALIALGVTGGIGAYKAVEVARGLQKRGHEVVAIMTRSAEKFVGPLTFEAITRRNVITDQYQPGANADIEHIAIASTIDLLLVAPATANTIGKFANGLADDFLPRLIWTITMLMSLGFTPEIREAWPKVDGRTLVSFRRASLRNEGTVA